MIKVTHEKIETVTEEFGLIELDGWLHSYRIYLRVPITMSGERAECVRKRVNAFLDRVVNGIGGVL